MKISIIIASYNKGKSIEQTIQSVISQQYLDYELIIFDACSNDETEGVLEKYKNNPNIKIFIEKDRGPADALNKGFSLATGEIMTFINADDILMPGSLENVARIFEKYGFVEWLTGKPTAFAEKGIVLYSGFVVPYPQRMIRKGIFDGRSGNFIQQEGTFWRKSLWEKSGCKIREDLLYLFDFELWVRFATNAKLYMVNASTGAFRHGDNLLRKNPNGYYEEIDRIIEHRSLLKKLLTLIHSSPFFLRVPLSFLCSWFIWDKYIHIDKIGDGISIKNSRSYGYF